MIGKTEAVKNESCKSKQVLFIFELLSNALELFGSHVNLAFASVVERKCEAKILDSGERIVNAPKGFQGF